MTTVDRDAPTLRPCPACEQCAMCEGKGKITCHRCPRPHVMDCPADSTCGLCEGTQLVSNERRTEWMRANPEPEPPKAA